MHTLVDRKITEYMAAAECAEAAATSVVEGWPEIRRELQRLPVRPGRWLDDEARLELGLAVLALQLQGLENFMKPEQAQRIRGYFVGFCRDLFHGEAAVATLELHDRAWHLAIANGRMPTYGIAEVLYDRFGFPSSAGPGWSDGRNLSVVNFLSDLIVRYGNLGWWKQLTATAELVPGDAEESVAPPAPRPKRRTRKKHHSAVACDPITSKEDV